VLRFRLRQVQVPSLDRYFLPLPKLTDAQLAVLVAHLDGRGFEVKVGGPGRRVAVRGGQRLSIDGRLGLAASRLDMLDALAPAVPAMLAAAKKDENRTRRVGGGGRRRSAAVGGVGGGEEGVGQETLRERYLNVKIRSDSVEIQFFPRMESSRTWTCLRKDGLSGLTPDEAAVLGYTLGGASRSSYLSCITAKPRQGSRRLQVGRNLYHESSITVSEFLSTLRTIDTPGPADSASYLPRDSILVLPNARLSGDLPVELLGEWCSPRD
jgi:hypothetical protein